MPVQLKNTYIIKQGNHIVRGTNIVLNAYKSRFFAGQNPTAYISVGTGTGAPGQGRTTMFKFLAAYEAQFISANYDPEAGTLYCVKKATIPAGQLAGATITEVGFSYNSTGGITTHSILPAPVTKGQEQIEIIAIIYAADNDCLVPGENPYIKCVFGQKSLTGSELSYAYLNYIGRDQAVAVPIAQRQPARFLSSSSYDIKFSTGLPAATYAGDLVLYIDGQPALVFRNTLGYTATNNGTLYTESYGRIDMGYLYSREIYQVIGSSGRALENTVYYDFSGGLADSRPRIISIPRRANVSVSKNGKHLYVWCGRMLKVYSWTKGGLFKAGELKFQNNITHLASCDNAFFVVCNHASTSGAQSTDKRFYWGEVSGEVSLRSISADLTEDADAVCATVFGENLQYILHFAAGANYKEYILSIENGNFSQNYSGTMLQGCDYLASSYRRGTLFGIKANPASYDDIKQTAVQGGGSMNLSLTARAYLTGHTPDRFLYTGEQIMALNSQTLELRIYYANTAQMITYRMAQNYNAQKVTLNDGYVCVVANSGEAVIYEALDPSAGLKEVNRFSLAESEDVDDIFIMAGVVVARGGDKLYCYLPNYTVRAYVRSERFQYNSAYNVWTKQYTMPSSSYKSVVLSLG